LAQLGIKIDVVCPKFPRLMRFPVELDLSITEHRVWPGFLTGIPHALLSSKEKSLFSANLMLQEKLSFVQPKNIISAGRKIFNQFIFPDLRTEWYPFARSKINNLAKKYRFDAVISSHEPGVDLLLGLYAKKKFGMNFIADLGDPLVTPYSPNWRKKWDSKFERYIMHNADKIVVTNDNVQKLLCSEHNVDDDLKIMLIPQGFPEEKFYTTFNSIALPSGMLNIVYTGNFYHDFRNPNNFACALKLLNDKNIALTIVGDNHQFLPLFSEIPNVRMFGKTEHFSCLALQKEADVLLNIGNVQDYQLPGKIYEYLGAKKPIFHIQTGSTDFGAELIKKSNAGIVAKNNIGVIQNALKEIITSWKSGHLKNKYLPNHLAIGQHSWIQRAQLYKHLLESLHQK